MNIIWLFFSQMKTKSNWIYDMVDNPMKMLTPYWNFDTKSVGIIVNELSKSSLSFPITLENYMLLNIWNDSFLRLVYVVCIWFYQTENYISQNRDKTVQTQNTHCTGIQTLKIDKSEDKINSAHYYALT